MSSEQQEPPPDGTQRQPTSELWGPWVTPEGESGKQDYRLVSGTQFKKPLTPAEPPSLNNDAGDGIDPQASFQEHTTAPSPAFRAGAPVPPVPQSPQPQQPPLYNPASYPGYANYAAPVTGNPPSQTFPPPAAGYAPPGSSYPNFAVPSPSYQGYVSGPPIPPVPPAYPPYGAYHNYPQPGAYPYAYPYAYAPPRPPRDGYLFGVGIAAFIGSILVLLGGLLSFFLLLFVQTVHTSTITADQSFAGSVLFAAFALIGLIGGGFGLYHSTRSVFLRKPSSEFSLPTFWLFVALYAALMVGGFVLHNQGQDQANLTLLAVLILLAGLFPALAVLALGNQRLRFRLRLPKVVNWPTSWRRLTFAIVSGATLGILVAGLLEWVLLAALVRGQGVNPLLCINNPNAGGCQNPNVYNLLFIAVAIIAPIVEETVKPLAVIILIGRMRSAAEAFVLGLACGIGFDLIETSGYIASSTAHWLDIALIRTGAGLLHGMGAGMVALGWYYLTHPGKNRIPKAVGCWLYAVVQHALWNGSAFMTLLPGGPGTFFSNTLTIGPVTLFFYEFVNIGEAIFILLFFLYITYRIREKTVPASLS
ncbi:MAG TPA: PrsW family glutamic-type intramembrane protease [Ktedonobacteraceae bacterium]|nr:PrsW family glutamic-type intramembrane protease [Ktedonobacteraceae bacterium]